MTQPNDLQVPTPRWFGRFKNQFDTIKVRAETDGQWYKIGTYARTTGYQRALALNLARYIGSSPWEFGSRVSAMGGSELWVRFKPRK